MRKILVIWVLGGMMGCGSGDLPQERECPAGTAGCACLESGEGFGEEQEETSELCAENLECRGGRCVDPYRGLSPRILTFRVMPSQVEPGGNVAVSWEALDVEACVLRAEGLGVDEREVGTQGSELLAVSEGVREGNYPVRLSCYYRGRQVENVASVKVGSGGGSGARISTFTVNGRTSPQAVGVGESLVVSWEAKEVEICAAGGNLPGWSGNRSVTGEMAVSTEGLSSGVYLLTLQCTDGAVDTAEVRRTVVVESEEMDCGDRLPPPGWEARFEAGEEGTVEEPIRWEELFGAPFPGVEGDRDVTTGVNGYVSVEFEVPEAFVGVAQVAHGALEQSGVGTGPKVWSVSACPGDFEAPVFGRCRQMDPSSVGIRFGTEESADFTAFHCPIVAGRTYYWNVFWGERDEGENLWGCGADRTRCGDRLSPWILLD